MTSGLEPTQLQSKADPDSWSAIDLLAHLRSCVDVWGKSIGAMLIHHHPTRRYISPRTWMRKTTYQEQDFHASLQLFTAQRTELLSLLQSPGPDGWARGATFIGTMRGREQTVLSYAQRIANHEAAHLMQLEEMGNTLRASRASAFQACKKTNKAF